MTTPTDAPDLAQRVLLACPLDSRQSMRALATRFGVPVREIGAVIDWLGDQELVCFVGDEMRRSELGDMVVGEVGG